MIKAYQKWWNCVCTTAGCGQTWRGYSASKTAAEHARRKGHDVHVTVEYTIHGKHRPLEEIER